MSESITVVGRGASWKECPFNTPEIWGTATCLITPELKDKPFTKVFAFDPLNAVLKEAAAVAKERNIPLVSLYEYATEKYPSREIVKEFRVSYFKNTASYMLAMAIYKKPPRLCVYGFEQNDTLNYTLFRPWVTFWFGVGFGRGIDMRFGRGVLNWQYKSLPLRSFLNEEELIKLSEKLGYRGGMFGEEVSVG